MNDVRSGPATGADISPRLRVLSSPEAVADEAAERLTNALKAPAPVLGLATGRTPLQAYGLLVGKVRAGEASFRDATTFNLDEYRGLAAEHPASFHSYMWRELFGKVDMAPERAHIPPGLADDFSAAAVRFERRVVEAGGIALQLLGIGGNGHIGFNEPGSPHDSRTRIVPLTESTRIANAPDFPAGEEMPREAITMGIGTILEAREIVLIAVGSRKAAAIKAALTGPVGPDCPASALRRHPNVTLLCDREAASLLP